MEIDQYIDQLSKAAQNMTIIVFKSIDYYDLYIICITLHCIILEPAHIMHLTYRARKIDIKE